MPTSRQSDTVPAAFVAMTSTDAARPAITFYDDATGERTELSGASLGNWVAKTANLLVDGCGLGAGDQAVVDAPPHWQTAAVLLGCWTAGLQVLDPAAAADVAFCAADRMIGQVGRAGEVFGLALAPLAAPLRTVPPGVTDFVIEVRAHGDHFSPIAPVRPEDPATALTHGQVCRAAAARARALGIQADGRVLIDAAAHPDPLDWLVAPVIAGASIVLCANLDRTSLRGRVEAERVTATLLLSS